MLFLTKFFTSTRLPLYKGPANQAKRYLTKLDNMGSNSGSIKGLEVFVVARHIHQDLRKGADDSSAVIKTFMNARPAYMYSILRTIKATGSFELSETLYSMVHEGEEGEEEGGEEGDEEGEEEGEEGADENDYEHDFNVIREKVESLEDLDVLKKIHSEIVYTLVNLEGHYTLRGSSIVYSVYPQTIE